MYPPEQQIVDAGWLRFEPKARSPAARLSAIASTLLYAPLFPEHRLAILQLLDKLRVAGLLTQVIPKTAIAPQS